MTPNRSPELDKIGTTALAVGAFKSVLIRCRTLPPSVGFGLLNSNGLCFSSLTTSEGTRLVPEGSACLSDQMTLREPSILLRSTVKATGLVECGTVDPAVNTSRTFWKKDTLSVAVLSSE